MLFEKTVKINTMIGNKTKIKDIMTREVITVQPNDPMEKVKDIFDHYSIHHIPVIHHKKVVGIISREDYLRIIQGFTLLDDKKTEAYNHALLRSLLAEEVMSTKVACLGPEDTLHAAAGYFRENLFHAIPIIDELGELAGIITTYDLINHAYREDGTVS
jgi:CBS domain-containing protein